MNFFHHKDLGNHLLQLCPKVVKHPVYIYIYIYIYYLILSHTQQPSRGNQDARGLSTGDLSSRHTLIVFFLPRSEGWF